MPSACRHPTRPDIRCLSGTEFAIASGGDGHGALSMPMVARSSVTKTEDANVDADTSSTAAGVGGSGGTAPPEPPAKAKPRPPAHYLCATLIARIYEVFPLICPMSGGQMRIIAFNAFSADIRRILDHIGVESEAPRITPARGPPLW